MKVRKTLIGLAAALALCACGAVGTAAPPSPSPSNPSTGTGRGFDVSVTEKDHSISIRVGQKLEAVLHANPGMSDWSGVRSSDPSILTSIVDTGATAVRGVTLAGFQAIAPGQAQITAVAGALCSPGQACPMFAQLLTIDVTVTPS
jgi:phage tail protein X